MIITVFLMFCLILFLFFNSTFLFVDYKVLPLQVKVDLGVMAMKGDTTFPKAPVLQ